MLKATELLQGYNDTDASTPRLLFMLTPDSAGVLHIRVVFISGCDVGYLDAEADMPPEGRLDLRQWALQVYQEISASVRAHLYE